MKIGDAAHHRGARVTGSVKENVAPASRTLVDAHPAALKLDKFLYQREPQSGTAELAACGAVDLAELFEDHVVIFSDRCPMPDRARRW